MLGDLRGAIWSELRTGRTIDTYRRNLQRGYLERMKWLMTEEPERPSSPFAARAATPVNVSQSDIRPVRGELEALRGEIQRSVRRAPDRATRLHLADVLVRIDRILDPKEE